MKSCTFSLTNTQEEDVDEADIVTANHMEIKAVACRSDLDDAIPKVMDNGIKTLIVKMGEDGARIVTDDGTDVTVPAFDVIPINATGTGDVFNAALVVALAEGRDLEEAVRFACAAGWVTVLARSDSKTTGKRFGRFGLLPGTRSAAQFILPMAAEARGTAT